MSCHSVEPRALTCPFKQSNLSARSLLSSHPTHTYLWGRRCIIQVCCLLSTVTVTPSHDSNYTEALLLNGFCWNLHRADEYDSLHSYIGVHVYPTVFDSTSTLTGNSDLSLRIITAPEFYEEAWRNGVEMEKNRKKSSNCDSYVTCVDVHCFLQFFLKLNRCSSCAIYISRGLIWQRVCYLKLSSVLFGTNCVFVITEYCGLNLFHH